jgi:hypothetical protein
MSLAICVLREIAFTGASEDAERAATKLGSSVSVMLLRDQGVCVLIKDEVVFASAAILDVPEVRSCRALYAKSS